MNRMPTARKFTLSALVLLAAGSVAAQPVFTDVTASAGVSYLQQVLQPLGNCIFDGYFCEPERMTGGAAVADIDGDGWVDLFVTRLDAPDILFRNLGNGAFENFTTASGLNAYNLQSNGAGFADIEVKAGLTDEDARPWEHSHLVFTARK